MGTYESSKELRRRVKEASKRAEEEALSTDVQQRSWIRDIGKEVFVELPNTLLLGLPKHIALSARAEEARQQKEKLQNESDPRSDK